MYNCIGLDVSKKLIAVYIPINKVSLEIENNVKAFKSLYLKLKKLYKKEINSLVFIFEPTGSYSFALTKFCKDKNIKSFLINPKQFSNHAKALGQRNKTDEVDSIVLSKSLHLARVDEIKVPYINEEAESIKELMSYYKFTSKQRNKTSNHLEALSSKDGNKYAIKELNNSIKDLKKKEVEILSKVQDIIEDNEELFLKYNNIKTLPGIGKIGAIVLLHLFIKYPKANQRQISALAGLDPIIKQSGTSVNKKPRISKAGSKLYRGTLFMGVMSAIRLDENFNNFFTRLKDNGKHTTVAQIAVMRKMIIIAHSLFKNNTQYDVDIYKKTCGYK
jgi:transposase